MVEREESVCERERASGKESGKSYPELASICDKHTGTGAITAAIDRQRQLKLALG